MVPGDLLAALVLAWTFGLIAVISYKLVTGQINLDGLLSQADGSGISPERIQLLLISLASLSTLAKEALANRAMPQPSDLTLVLSGFGGSQAIYIVGKYARYLVSEPGHKEG
jgi:hypothetical protein